MPRDKRNRRGENSRSKSTSTGPEGGTDGENGKPDNPEIPDRYANPGGCPARAGVGIYAEGGTKERDASSEAPLLLIRQTWRIVVIANGY